MALRAAPLVVVPPLSVVEADEIRGATSVTSSHEAAYIATVGELMILVGIRSSR